MKTKKTFLKRVLAVLVIALVTIGSFNSYALAQEVSRLTYEAHSQKIGWQSEVSGGAISGTTGRALRLEALKIKLSDELQAKGDIEYRVHVKSKGWLSWVKNGAQAGTTGESRRAEAVEIRLTGELSTLFDVEYQIHVKSKGWLSWVKNGAQAGTTGESRRAEAVKIRLVEKASSPSTDDKEDPEVPEVPEVPEEPSTPPSTPETIKYSVTFRTNAKDVVDGTVPDTEIVKSGGKATQPTQTPERAGYDFKGWAKTRDGEDYWQFEEDTVSAATTLYAKWQANNYTVTLAMNDGTDDTLLLTETYDEIPVTLKTIPVRETYRLLGWYNESSGGTKILNSDGTFSAKKIDGFITKGKWTKAENVTLYAQWQKTYQVTLKDGTEIISTETFDSGSTFEFPTDENENYYFLGWTEGNNKAASVYVPKEYSDIRTDLNVPDQTYLGYPINKDNADKPISSISVDRDFTFNAVHYKKLEATDIASESTPTAQECIWAKAIWRVVNTNVNQSSGTDKRLLLKVNALTNEEITSLTNPNTEKAESVENTSYGSIYFDDILNMPYFSDNVDDTGYNGSKLKRIIDGYYNNHISSHSDDVLPVDLDLPTLSTYLDLKDKFSENNTFNGWGWNSYDDYYKDNRFVTSLIDISENSNGFEKQAFALSLGDLNIMLGLQGEKGSKLLDFPGTLAYYYWLRSPGYYSHGHSGCTYGDFGAYAYSVDYNMPVRPAVWVKAPSAKTNYKVDFDLGFETASTIKSQYVEDGGTVIEPTIPTRDGFIFDGWYDGENEFDFETEISGNKMLTAEWATPQKVNFMNYDGSSLIIPNGYEVSEKVVKNGGEILIPNAPEVDGQVFLGWAEGPSIAPGTSNQSDDSLHPALYTSSSEIGIAALNQPDKRYLGYKAKNDYTISNITTDKTLYAVYYKSLQGTTLASKDNPTAQEFIWNDAIWRVINTKSTGVTASNRLVIKVNALTQRDLDQSEKESTAYVSFSKNSFYFASSNTIQGNGYETGASETGVDNRKYLKGAIDYYYEHKIQDETNVEKVNLNNPTFEQYRSIGFTGSVTGTPAYSNWSWDNWSRDTRFSTSLDGDKKQAFALSFGDINKFTTLESDGIKALLLNFSGTNTYQYWLRSPGRSAMYAGAINSGSMGYDFSVRQSITEKIRPALWLSIN